MTRELTRAFLALEVPAAIKERLAAAQENLRRYMAGEALLSVVDIERGY